MYDFSSCSLDMSFPWCDYDNDLLTNENNIYQILADAYFQIVYKGRDFLLTNVWVTVLAYVKYNGWNHYLW